MAYSVQLRIAAIGFLLGVLSRSWLHMSRVNAHELEASVFALPVVVVVVFVAGLLIASGASGAVRRVSVIFGFALVLGVFRFESALPGRMPLPEKPALFSGVVTGPPIVSRLGITVNVADMQSRIFVARVPRQAAPIAAGSRVEVFCRLVESRPSRVDPFTGPYRQVFSNQRKNIVGQCAAQRIEVLAAPTLLRRVKSLPERFREKLLLVARTMIPEPQATVLGSIALGVSRDLPLDIVEAFRKTGTLHILVVSGSHFSLLSAWMQSLLAVLPLSALARSFSIAGGLFLFLALIGFPAPAVRGWLAALTVLASGMLTRPRSAIHLLLVIAAGMAFVDPWLPLFSLGFQLSVFATLGIISLTEPIRGFFASVGGGGMPILSQATSTTIAASVATIPLLLGAFGTLSLVTVVANLVAVALAPGLLVLGLAFFAVAVIAPSVAILLAPLVSFTMTAFVEVIKSFADVAWASVTVGRVSGFVVAIESVAFIAVCWRAAAPAVPRLPYVGVSGRVEANS